jgi:hypothetical protein
LVVSRNQIIFYPWGKTNMLIIKQWHVVKYWANNRNKKAFGTILEFIFINYLILFYKKVHK